MKYTPEQIINREHVSSKKNRNSGKVLNKVEVDPQTGQRYFADVLGDDINLYRVYPRSRNKYQPGFNI